MNKDQLLSQFSSLNTWRSSGMRAPHKPLLILLALAEWRRGRDSLRFEDALEPLTALLRTYGPPRSKVRPQDPFWRLQTDGVWEVTPSTVQLGSDSSPSAGELRRVNATGQFTTDIRSAFLSDPGLVPLLAQFILQSHFPESIHQDILDDIGLEIAEPRASGGGRDPNFRRLVLTAYEFRCAVCDLQILLSGSPIAIEAAHIKWHQASGPSIVSNGLALCVLHHKTFDLGAFTLSEEGVVLVSDEVTGGSSGFDEYLLNYHGRRIRKPVHSQDAPAKQFIQWHVEEVFRGRSRPIV